MKGDEITQPTVRPAQADATPKESSPAAQPADPAPPANKKDVDPATLATTAAAEENPWQYRPADGRGTAAQQTPANASFNASSPGQAEPQEVTWTASEFIAHAKKPIWFITLGVVTVILSVLFYLWNGDILTVVVLPVFAILFGIIAARKPRVLEYQLNTNGLLIGEKFYPYSDFKSFSIIDDGAFAIITFLPLKRFMPTVSVYYEPTDEERIMVVLGQHLPMEQRDHDIVDRMARGIRF